MAPYALGLLACLLSLSIAAGTPVANEQLATMKKGMNDFAIDLYMNAVEASGADNKNFVVSPLSAGLVTAMLQEGAKGETANEIAKVLRLPADQAAREMGFSAIYDDLKDHGSAELRIANRLYVAKSSKLKDEFNNIVSRVHKSDVQSADFAQNAETERTNINNWVAEQTKQKIKDLLLAGDVSKDTSIVLVNALYFKDQWKRPFLSGLTRQEKFHQTKDKSVDALMMQQTSELPYAEIAALDAKAVELCYQTQKVCMQVIVPNAVDGLAAMKQKLRSGSADLSAIQFQNTPNLQLFMPRFKIDNRVDIQKVYKKMGINKIFDKGAELSGIAEGQELTVGTAVQKAFIEVDEDGTEAAAATGLGVWQVSLPIALVGDKVLKVNRPFLFRLHWNQVTMFIGSVAEPNQNYKD